MPTKTKRTAAKPASKDPRVREALAWLEEHADAKIRDEMGQRYGIHTDKAFGVSMANMKALGKSLGRDHDLAAALWDAGWYEARLVASFVDEPSLVTPEQMERWCRDFGDWGVCDTVCFHLFDRTPHAWAKVEEWADDPGEFVKRAAYVLLACLALHDKRAGDERFLRCLPLVERAATDERNLVKKGLVWALRAIAKRNPKLEAETKAVVERLAASPPGAARWVGKTTLRELTRPAKA
jgi:3-methyladenine DNA glycosylase AlkD